MTTPFVHVQCILFCSYFRTQFDNVCAALRANRVLKTLRIVNSNLDDAKLEEILTTISDKISDNPLVEDQLIAQNLTVRLKRAYMIYEHYTVLESNVHFCDIQ